MILALPISPCQTAGTLLLSGLVAPKSRFRTLIWLLIWAFEMFSEARLWTTWTTTGIVITLRVVRCAKPDAMLRSVN